MAGKFIAQPGMIRRGGEMMEGLPAQTNRIVENFITDAHSYRPYAGYNDDFAMTELPKYDRNNQSCIELLNAVSTAFSELRQAVWSNGRHIEGVSAYAQEQISRQSRNLDGLGGGSHGGGRH